MPLRFAPLCFVAIVTCPTLVAQDVVKPVPVKPDAPIQMAPLVPALPAQRLILRGQAVNFAVARNHLNLSQLIRAKIDLADGGKARLIFMLESFRQRKGEKVIQEMVPEERTREVMVNGKSVKQSFTVMKRVVRIEENADISVAAGIKPKTFDAKEFEFYDLGGEALSVDAAAKRLTKLSPIFLLDMHNGNVEGLSEIARQALNENCMIVTTPKQIRPQSKQPANQWLQVVPPKLMVAPALAPPLPVQPAE